MQTIKLTVAQALVKFLDNQILKLMAKKLNLFTVLPLFLDMAMYLVSDKL